MGLDTQVADILYVDKYQEFILHSLCMFKEIVYFGCSNW